MQRILSLTLLMVTLVGVARAQGTAAKQADAEIEKEVLKVEHEKDQAMRRGDVAALNRIYADDLSFVNTHGQVLTKAQRLADLRHRSLKYLTYSRGDYRFHIYGDTVVLTGRSSSVVEYHGKIIRTPRQFMQVYIKQDGRWRMVSHQAAFVAKQ